MCQYACPSKFTAAANKVVGTDHGCFTDNSCSSSKKRRKVDFYTRCYQDGSSHFLDFYCNTDWHTCC